MTIDTRGKLCPEPLIITRRAIADAPQGSAFEILSDNATARDNLMNYLRALGHGPVCDDRNGIFHIIFTVGEATPAAGQVRAEDFCRAPQAPAGDYAVVVRSSVMGAGDDELGAMLMRSCLNSLAELDALPSAVVLYNSGVMLAVEGTDTAASLARLAESGVQVIVCGACVDYFGIKERLAAGTVSNMLSINNLLAGVGHIIYP